MRLIRRSRKRPTPRARHGRKAMRILTTAALAFALIASGSANAEQVLLSCWGTVELIQQGKRVNPVDERSAVAVAVDIAKKTITISGVTWPMAGDVSREAIVSMDPDKGSLTLNRTTGALTAHFIELNGKSSTVSANRRKKLF